MLFCIWTFVCNSFGAHKPNKVLRPLCYMNCQLFCCWRLWKIAHPNMLYNAICFWMYFDVSYSNKNDLIWFDLITHDDVIKWKHFPRHCPFVRGIHLSPVNSPHKGQWRGALMFSLICVWINGWVNDREAGDLRRYRAHYDVTVMMRCIST